MKSIYIAGPITAQSKKEEDQNILVAIKYASQYLRAGWAVFCPHCMVNIDRTLTWEAWMTIDIYWLNKCDAILMLPGWELSKGARIEHTVALGLGIEIIYAPLPLDDSEPGWEGWDGR